MGYCRHYCNDWKSLKRNYDTGIKYCAVCQNYLITERKFCPCCSTQLRTTPVDKHLRVKRLNKKKLGIIIG